MNMLIVIVLSIVFFTFFISKKKMLEHDDEMQFRSSVSYDFRYFLYDKILLIPLLCLYLFDDVLFICSNRHSS